MVQGRGRKTGTARHGRRLSHEHYLPFKCDERPVGHKGSRPLTRYWNANPILSVADLITKANLFLHHRNWEVVENLASAGFRYRRRALGVPPALKVALVRSGWVRGSAQAAGRVGGRGEKAVRWSY